MLTLRDLKALREIVSACEVSATAQDGAMTSWAMVAPVSCWTSGSGRHTKPRALPQLCRTVERDGRENGRYRLNQAEAAAAAEFFTLNGRRKKCIVIRVDSAIAYVNLGFYTHTPEARAAAEALADTIISKSNAAIKDAAC